MAPRYRNVATKEFPETKNSAELRSFMDEFASCMNRDRPCLVLDCSKLVRLDLKAVHLLLSCLEEAIKRNGDVRLAGVSQSAKAILKFYGVDGLFEIFDSTAEAINSFYPSALISPLHANAPIDTHKSSKETA